MSFSNGGKVRGCKVALRRALRHGDSDHGVPRIEWAKRFSFPDPSIKLQAGFSSADDGSALGTHAEAVKMPDVAWQFNCLDLVTITARNKIENRVSSEQCEIHALAISFRANCNAVFDLAVE